jgi:hypothetical protein
MAKRKKYTAKQNMAHALLSTLGLAIITISPYTHDGIMPKSRTEHYNEMPLTTAAASFFLHRSYVRAESPSQEQLDYFAPTIRDELDRIPPALLEQCISRIIITGSGMTLKSMESINPGLNQSVVINGFYNDRRNHMIISLPEEQTNEKKQQLRETFWHELHHGCADALETHDDIMSYEALREERPEGDIVGYAWEYGKENRHEDEATLMELIGARYNDYAQRIKEDSILKEKGELLKERY